MGDMGFGIADLGLRIWDVRIEHGAKRISEFSRGIPIPSGRGAGRNLPKRSRDGAELARAHGA